MPYKAKGHGRNRPAPFVTVIFCGCLPRLANAPEECRALDELVSLFDIRRKRTVVGVKRKLLTERLIRGGRAFAKVEFPLPFTELYRLAGMNELHSIYVLEIFHDLTQMLHDQRRVVRVVLYRTGEREVVY